MGIVGSEIASSAQLKGVETIVAGIEDSEMGTDDSESFSDSNLGSVCVDIDAEEDGGSIGEFV